MIKINTKDEVLLDSKKKIIQYKLLNDNCCYDSMVFRLIKTEHFNKIISKIDDTEIIYSVKIKQNDNITSSDFIFLLNRLVDLFKSKFPTIKFHLYTMEKILDYNIEIVEKYFFDHYNDIDREYENIVTEKVYKILINSFVSNAKYVPEISKILRKKKIEIYPTIDYSFEECKIIIKLLQDIVFCNKGIGIDCLFDNIELIINNQLSDLSSTVRKNRGDDYYIEKTTNFYIKLYEKVFHEYESKKQFIKYFK